MSLSQYDKKLAKSLHDQLNCIGITENAVIPKEKENYKPRTLVDQTLEYIDPTPNIYTLFVQFNTKFFWNVLLPVEVKWSPRMTSCAGVCTFHPRNKQCVISLSSPLLKLRPRKDLIETLLHEMIHAYLFLTNDNRDRDGHGPVFQSHMRRINKEAGTNITIYHDFHEEVRLYQQHWWRCNGPCQKRSPYFGMVRRAMNRAPGPYDNWWNEHQRTCGGQFIKIKEPEKPEAKKNSKKGKTNTVTVNKPSDKNSVLNWVQKDDNNKSVKEKDIFKPPNQSHITNKNKTNVQTDLKKLGNTTNNVYGWGVGGPNSSSSKNTPNLKNLPNNSQNNDRSRFSFTGTLGGKGTGRSNLLDKFSKTSTNVPLKTNSPSTSNHNKTMPSKNSKDSREVAVENNRTSTITTLNKTTSPTNSSKNSSLDNYFEKVKIVTVNCPNCPKLIEESKINEHLDMCLLTFNEPEIIPTTSNKKRKSEDRHSTPIKIFKTDNTADTSNEVECPLCNKKILPQNFNDHLDTCVPTEIDEKIENSNNDDVILLDESGSSSINLHDSPHVCLICDKVLAPNETLNDHLEECVASVFNGTDDSDTDKTEINEKVELDKFPCPVCMQLIHESLMNEHLDTCLNKE